MELWIAPNLPCAAASTFTVSAIWSGTKLIGPLACKGFAIFKNIRPLVFWPTFLVLLGAVVLSFVNLEQFLAITKAANDAILNNFSWLFSAGAFYLVILAAMTYVSPLADVRIGGKDAEPLLAKHRWFFISICTTIAVGLLFWTTAEPIYHFNAPPISRPELEAGSPQAALFAISSLFLHWSFTPYAIYSIPSLVFALAFYNKKLPFSISSSLAPVFGFSITKGKRAQLIDTLAMYALVAGMAGSLGTGAVTLVGGIGEFSSVTSNPISLGIVIALVVAAFVASAASGLYKGIARLSAINAVALIFLGLFVFIFGPTVFILRFGVEGLGEFLNNFISMSLFTGAAADDSWPQQWSIFSWAAWVTWAPVTALFLGRIARGYTVREFLQINLIFPAVFSIIWVAIFTGSAIHLDMTESGAMNTILNEQGIEKLLYFMMDRLPLSGFISVLLVFIAFISYVTAADSNTDAIGALCTDGFSAETDARATLPMKVLWGVTIGVVSWTMVAFVGIDGIKMLSNLGGLPALLIVLAVSLTLIKWVRKPDLIHSVSRMTEDARYSHAQTQLSQ